MSMERERTALIARQGLGARYDAVEAPSEDLLLARRGTAYFARLLNGLSNDALVDGPGAFIVARVGYHARGLTRLMTWARTGVETPEHTSTTVRDAEVALGASLPAQALRGLFDHASVHLDVEWRDLPGPAWGTPLHLLDGTRITARNTPMIRARMIWNAALELGAGGRLADLPPSLRRG